MSMIRDYKEKRKVNNIIQFYFNDSCQVVFEKVKDKFNDTFDK